MIWRIAFRNMLRQRRRTALTLLTMFGGFTLAAVSIGWSDGTYTRIIAMFTRDRLGQIEVHRRGYLQRPSLYDTIRNYPAIGGAIGRIDGVETWTPRVFSVGLTSHGDKTAGAQLIGIDPGRENRATGFNKKLIDGKPLSDTPAHEALLGRTLAQILGAVPGDPIVIVSQGSDGSIADDVYNLSGIVDTGDEALNRTAFYLHIKDAQDLLLLDSAVHEIVVMIYDLNRTEAIAGTIRDRLADPELDVQPWQDFARFFYIAMKADQKGMWIMLVVIVLIVSVGVLNTVLMSVLERRREYGLLRALGTRPGQIAALVLAEVLLIALGGVMLGIGVSTAVNALLSVRGVPLPTPITYGGVEFDRMYSEVNARSLYIPAVTVILSALLVGLPPAWKAARARPAQAMKTF